MGVLHSNSIQKLHLRSRKPVHVLFAETAQWPERQTPRDFEQYALHVVYTWH